MARQRNIEWNTPENPNFTWDHVQVELLMDIRAELKKLNKVFECGNFLAIPQTLTAIRLHAAATQRNTAWSRKARKRT